MGNINHLRTNVRCVLTHLQMCSCLILNTATSTVVSMYAHLCNHFISIFHFYLPSHKHVFLIEMSRTDYSLNQWCKFFSVFFSPRKPWSVVCTLLISTEHVDVNLFVTCCSVCEDWNLTHGMFSYLMNRVSLDIMSVQANTGPRWAKKNATAFWRGRDSRQERLELVKLSRAHPHMIDAAFTNFFFFKHDESLYGPLVKHVSFFDFFKVIGLFLLFTWR